MATPDTLPKQPTDAQYGIQTAYSHLNTSIVIVDARIIGLPITFVNQAFTELTGYSPEDCIGRNCSFLQGSDTSQEVINEMRACIKSGTIFTGVIKNYRKDGSLFWNKLSINPLHDPNGTVTHFIGMQLDITSEIDAEADNRSMVDRQGEFKAEISGLQEKNTVLQHELDRRIQVDADLERVSEEVLKQASTLDTILSSSKDSISVFDREGKYIYLNPSSLNNFGMAIEDIVGKRPIEVDFEPGIMQEVDQSIQTVLTTKSIQTNDVVIQSGDGRQKTLEYVVNPVVMHDGTIDGAVIISRDITERRRTEETIRHLAYHDPLTNLPNRIYFEDLLQERISQNPKEAVNIMAINVDRFKVINDTFGHLIGDQLIVQLGMRLQMFVEDRGICSRIGGDEFIILLNGITSNTAVELMASNLLEMINQPFLLGNQDIHITAGIGVSRYPYHGADPIDLIRNADIALHLAKSEGRNSLRMFTLNMGEQQERQLQIENDLMRGIEEGEFSVYYQPLKSLKTGGIVKTEALLRWHHPELGIITPNLFIPVAEESGAITRLTEWVFNQVGSDIRNHLDRNYPTFTVAVNLSPRQLMQADLFTIITGMLETYDIDPSCIQVEITETTALQDVELAVLKLQGLEEMGIQAAIDDFGSGYASLAYLKLLPIQTLKIDKSLITDCVGSRQDAAIIKAIIDLGHTLDLQVVAEGVETDRQLELIQGLGCDVVQGYIIGKAMPLLELEKLLA